jgi:excisionase family DNA binding protein
VSDENGKGIGAAFAGLAAMPGAVAEVRSLVADLGDRLSRIEEALPSPLGSIEDAARVTGLSRSSIKRFLKNGQIRSIRLGRQVRVDLRDLKPFSRNIAAAAAKARAGK